MTLAAKFNLMDAGRRVLGAISRWWDAHTPILGAGPLPSARQDGPVESIDMSARAVAMRDYLTDFDNRVTTLANRLAAGDINLATWRAQMGIEVRALHTFAHANGAGGFANLTPETIAAIEQKIAEQNTYLDRWVEQMSSQEHLSDEQIAMRARMYGGSGNASFHAGMATEVGMPTLPQYPGDGNTRCRTNCRCHLEIETLEPGNWDVYWRLGVAEHCPDCIDLAERWSPLRIRDGQIV